MMFGILEWVTSGILRKRVSAGLREGVKIEHLLPLTAVKRLFPRSEYADSYPPSGNEVAVAALLDTVGLGERVWGAGGPRNLAAARTWIDHDLDRFPGIREVRDQLHVSIANRAALTV